ncbi:hypothetical protein AB0P17_24370 [Streptomyces sp. NPDC088124]|uniref:hypothetical protein n=1 Tax=Streptomyces sp. NPDC088124 TaxID=3154654 RepID=UPI003447D74D
MSDMRSLWWQAGRLAFSVSTTEWMNDRWHRALHRSATLLEPVWPTESDAGPFTHALPTIALVLYSGPHDVAPEDVPVTELLATLTPRQTGAPLVEDTVRPALMEHGHHLDDDSPLSTLFRQLTEPHKPLTHTSTGLELPFGEHVPGGTLLHVSAEWASETLNFHCPSSNVSS